MRKEFKNQQDLDEAIVFLEKKSEIQKNIIANNFSRMHEDLKPINLIKKHKEIILIGVLGLGTGYLIRKLLIKQSTGLMAKMTGSLIQWGIAALLSKNSDKIRSNVGPVARRVLKRQNPVMQIIKVEARD
jgi:hypothetical protein